jgi:hypothetical protein
MTEEEEAEAADEKESPVAIAGFGIDRHRVGFPCTENVGFGTWISFRRNAFCHASGSLSLCMGKKSEDPAASKRLDCP